jgi:hypothetical protein
MVKTRLRGSIKSPCSAKYSKHHHNKVDALTLMEKLPLQNIYLDIILRRFEN